MNYTVVSTCHSQTFHAESLLRIILNSHEICNFSIGLLWVKSPLMYKQELAVERTTYKYVLTWLIFNRTWWLWRVELWFLDDFLLAEGGSRALAF